MWTLVAWGIYRSVVKSADQLRAQRIELTRQADLLEQQAKDYEGSQAKKLRNQAAELRDQVRNFWRADWKYLVLAGATYAAAISMSGLYWNMCLTAIGQTAPWPIVIWAYFYGNLGKYVPGKAMVVLLEQTKVSGVCQVPFARNSPFGCCAQKVPDT